MASHLLSFSSEELEDVSQHEYPIVKSIMLLFFDDYNSSLQETTYLPNFHIYELSSPDFYPSYDMPMSHNQYLHMAVSPDSHAKPQVDLRS